ncbi:hypothetical protein FNL55_15545 [Tardiphaga sp. vice352]|uniref:hypothetical protein n=1 Tax=unclassified Tardiphaga TaxID=2631404 RepID=UPI0011656694|nr:MULTISPECIES: hypothetical protein [unclassified Tardiphaga]MBC7504259.1 hypothetical protein [Sandarakinorhabdus sp.]QDM17249.1 hypothetical protein FNL53_15860 [Tardiphaga sp. vice278]QDM27464.1 hypothetical protein FNL56_16055 [Tardiphaga sp. vice304]QDM32605.1 hypothetical protein FNL55_15545 [Tardiphaga sp. vice352]
MANPTPRADALRQMREAKFEAEQRRLKQETSKPTEAPRRKPEPTAAAGEDKPAKAKASLKPPPKATAPVAERAEIATAGGAEVFDAAPAAKASAEPSVEPGVSKTAKKTSKSAAPKATAKKAATKKAKTSSK